MTYKLDDQKLKKLIAKLQKESKSIEDAVMIQECVRDTNFFRKLCLDNEDTLSSDAIIQLCRNLSYELHPAKSVIIHQGEASNNKFYIILKGRVEVYLRSSDDQLLGTLLNTLYDGEQFGEKVLIELNAKRNASIVAKDECHLLIMQKHFYVNLFKWFGQAFLFKSLQLQRIIPCLDKVSSKKTLDNLIYYFKDYRFIKGQHVIRSGTLSDQIYFLAEGTCQLLRNFKKTSDRDSDVLAQKIPDHDLFPEQYQDEHIHISEIQELGVIGDEVLVNYNEEDGLQNLKEIYLYDAVITSKSAILYSIKSMTLIQHFPPESLHMLKLNYIDKQAKRQIIFQSKVQKIYNKWISDQKDKATRLELAKFINNPHPKHNFQKNPNFYNRFSHAIKSRLFLKQRQQANVIPQTIPEHPNSQQGTFNRAFVPQKALALQNYLKNTKQSNKQSIQGKPDRGTITLQQFIQLQRHHSAPIQLFQKVEDPFEFAQPEKTAANKKLQFSYFIQCGMIKIPKPEREQSSNEQSFMPNQTRRLLNSRPQSVSPAQSQTISPKIIKKNQSCQSLSRLSRPRTACVSPTNDGNDLQIKSIQQIEINSPNYSFEQCYTFKKKARIVSGKTVNNRTVNQIQSNQSLFQINSNNSMNLNFNDHLKSKFFQRNQLKSAQATKTQKLIKRIFEQ